MVQIEQVDGFRERRHFDFHIIVVGQEDASIAHMQTAQFLCGLEKLLKRPFAHPTLAKTFHEHLHLTHHGFYILLLRQRTALVTASVIFSNDHPFRVGSPSMWS